jgi:hypothetical protein
MARKQIFQLDPIAEPLPTYYMVVQQPYGAEEAMKMTLAQLKQHLALDTFATDVKVTDYTKGVVHTSSDGSQHRITVDRHNQININTI